MTEVENVSIEQYVSDVLSQVKKAAEKNKSGYNVNVEFELSVVANTQTNSKTSGGIGLVSVLNLGAIGSSSKGNETQTTNRIKFSITI